MARIVLTNVEVLVGGVDLSDHVASVTIQSTYDAVETTAFGGGNVPSAARTRQAGLVDNSVTLEFHQDFAAGDVEATIYPLLGTLTSLLVKPVADTISATNPAYKADGTDGSGQVLITDWTPLNGAVGELSTASVTWPISGRIVKDTTP
jgi:hypothetical protein